MGPQRHPIGDARGPGRPRMAAIEHREAVVYMHLIRYGWLDIVVTRRKQVVEHVRGAGLNREILNIGFGWGPFMVQGGRGGGRGGRSTAGGRGAGRG